MSLEWKVLLQLLTYISILIEEVVYPRSLCLGVDIWNKYSLVLSPLYTSWYTAIRAQLVYIHCERKTFMDRLYTTHFKYCHLSHLKHPKYSEILLHSECKCVTFRLAWLLRYSWPLCHLIPSDSLIIHCSCLACIQS